uniref:Uncharacterized protein n=1 Tax=Candidatus Kentrum sp. LPFa TaxID=2126335 RepID=A0A450WL29_9GAMM|nr:MAG: hypothetical protein BECKLPF1236B_GA0070989_112410 [Candidatus Kentron sp. LPFa]
MKTINDLIQDPIAHYPKATAACFDPTQPGNCQDASSTKDEIYNSWSGWRPAASPPY